MEVRLYRPADAPALADLHAPARKLPGQIAGGLQVWVATDGGKIVGYATLAPVPGLPGVFDLDGFVAWARRRQGIGSALLCGLLTAVQGTGATQLSHAVSSPTSAAARFLRAHHFYAEHEEWWLERENPAQIASPTLPDGFRLHTYNRPEAIRHFRALYEQSFGGTPWYQPYTPAEVVADLQQSDDLLFLVSGEEPVGFAWTRQQANGEGVIEPFGIVPPYQRQGLGRVLLEAALHRLARRGAQRVHIGLWRRNKGALALYQEAGFRHVATQYYLARDLPLSAG